MSFEIDENSIPPPLSLSAPELGAEPPIVEYLKLSASSTELLHERAMIRFYEEAAAEEAEMLKLKGKLTGERKQSIIPKIQINSKDNEDIVGLERKHSLRRRLSAGGSLPQQVLWARKRHSLVNSTELQAMSDNKLHKFPEILDNDKVKQFEEEKQKKIAEENVYDEVEGTDYEEVSDDSQTDKYKRYRDDDAPKRVYEEEDETYHPRMSMKPSIKSEEPFEILTKPNKLPDPNFVPKPILKRRDDDEFKNIRLDPGYISRQRSKSLVTEQILQTTAAFRQLKKEDSPSPRQRSQSLITSPEDSFSLPVPLPERRGSLTAGLGQTVSAIASISGIAAAGIVIPKTLLNKKKDEEEAKVVVDHYGDIVKSYGQRKKKNPNIHEETDKKMVNNIFSVRQIQKQQSVDENNYEAFINESSKSSQSSLESMPKENMKESPEAPRRSSFLESNWNAPRKLSSSPMRLPSTPLRRERKASPIPRESPSPFKISRTPSPIKPPQSPRKERKSSPSPLRISRSPSPIKPTKPLLARKTSPLKLSRSPSPVEPPQHHPMMKEIMTQTSNAIDPYRSQFCQTAPISSKQQEELLAKAEVMVRNSVEYVTDLAMFGVACYLYLFSNELFAIPVLLVMVYRQLKDELRKRIPKWMSRKPKET